jgi:molybdopterin-guanine dinucleotide biosynthesis protein A
MGQNKAYLSFQGMPFVLSLIALLKDTFHELFLVGKNHDLYGDLGIPFVQDGYPLQGAAVGVASGLRAAQHEWLFVCAVDMPLIKLPIVSLLDRQISSASSHHLGIIPSIQGRLEPLCAFYRRRFLDVIDRELQKKRTPSLGALLCANPTIKLDVPRELSESLTNVNTPQEYKKLL